MFGKGQIKESKIGIGQKEVHQKEQQESPDIVAKY